MERLRPFKFFKIRVLKKNYLGKEIVVFFIKNVTSKVRGQISTRKEQEKEQEKI